MRKQLPTDLSQLLRRDFSTCTSFNRFKFLLASAVAQQRIGVQAASFLSRQAEEMHLAEHAAHDEGD